jgi:hypothetical protein
VTLLRRPELLAPQVGLDARHLLDSAAVDHHPLSDNDLLGERDLLGSHRQADAPASFG